MPHVTGVDRPVATGPRTHQIGPQGGDASGEDAAPVVSDQIHGLADPLQPLDEPVDVLLLGGAEAVRSRLAEPGQVPGLHVGPGQMTAYAVPHMVGVGNTVDQDRSHESGPSSVTVTGQQGTEPVGPTTPSVDVTPLVVRTPGVPGPLRHRGRAHTYPYRTLRPAADTQCLHHATFTRRMCRAAWPAPASHTPWHMVRS